MRNLLIWLVFLSVWSASAQAQGPSPLALLEGERKVPAYLELRGNQLALQLNGRPLKIASAAIRRIDFRPLWAGQSIVTLPADTATPLSWVVFWNGDRLAGRLLQLSTDTLTLDFGAGPRSVPRGAVQAVVGRHNQFLLSAVSGSELLTKTPAQWQNTLRGQSGTPVAGKGFGLPILPVAGMLRTTLAQPADDAAVELTFADRLNLSADQEVLLRWEFGAQFVQLTLMGGTNQYLIETSPNLVATGPSLKRAAGWHRLQSELTPNRFRVNLDGFELFTGGAKNRAQQVPPLTAWRCEVRPRSKPAPAVKTVSKEPLLDLGEVLVWQQAAGLPQQLEEPLQDGLLLTHQTELWGRLETLSPTEVTLATQLGDVSKLSRWPLAQVRVLRFRRQALAVRPMTGWQVTAELRSTDPAAQREPAIREQVTGQLRSIDEHELTLEHPFCGPLVFPVSRLSQLTILGTGEQWDLWASPLRLGNQARPEWQLVPPDGTAFRLPFTLTNPLPKVTVLTLDSQDVESVQGKYRTALLAGQLTTEVWLNGTRLGTLNENVGPFGRIRLAVPAEVLRAGGNELEFRQQPSKQTPPEYDDLLLRRIRLEASQE